MDAIDARRLAFPAQQDEQPPIAEPSAFVGKLAKARPQVRIRRPARPVANHLPIRAHDAAGPTFRQIHHGLQMRDRFALDGRPYLFLTEALASRPRRAFARPGASSASRSRTYEP